jgi:hypothetical protein
MRGKGAKLGEGDPERKNPETNSGFLRQSRFRIFTFRIVSFRKSLWCQDTNSEISYMLPMVHVKFC